MIRQKQAELLSTLGAGVLGGGIALWLAVPLQRYASSLVLAGIVVHAGGMYAKHRAEKRAGAVTTYGERALYGLCWVVLLALIAYVAVTWTS